MTEPVAWTVDTWAKELEKRTGKPVEIYERYDVDLARVKFAISFGLSPEYVSTYEFADHIEVIQHRVSKKEAEL